MKVNEQPTRTYLKLLERKEQDKPKTSKRELIKTGTKINEIETKKPI
jgi:hypothetical protein